METRNERKIKLQNELSQIIQEEKDEEVAARIAKSKFYLSNIDALLSLVPEHGRTSCSDSNAINVERCNRCFLLEQRASNYWDEEYVVDLSIRRVKLY